jgi:hypothetical protein
MTTLPPITLAHPFSLIAAVFTPWIALGIAMLFGFLPVISPRFRGPT